MPVSLPSGLTPWVWYDAADSTTVSTTGTSVTGWMNKGSAAGGSGSTSGTVSYGTTNINGIPTVSIGASSYVYTGNMTPTSQNNTVFIVNRVPIDIPSGNYLSPFTAATNSIPWTFFGNDANGFLIGTRTNAGNKVYTNPLPNFKNRTAVYTISLSSTTANNLVNINGSTQSLAFNVAAGDQTLNTTYYFMQLQSDVAEVLVYMGDITTAQRQQIEGYLAWKWGLQSQLPASHPYSPAVFTHTLSQRPLPKPWLWLDADDASTITKSGSTLTSIRNKGYAGGTASGSGTTISTGTTTLNGKNVLRYNMGLNAGLRTTPIAASSDSFSVFTVQQIDSFQPYNYYGVGIYEHGQSVNAIYDGSQYKLTTNMFYLGAQQYYRESIIPNPMGAAVLYSAIGSSQNAANNYIGVNGNILNYFSNSTQTGIITAAGECKIGIIVGSPPQSSMVNRFAEIMVFMGEMTVEQRLLIEGYLAWKWGLQGSLPISHPFYAVPYINREVQQYSMPMTIQPWVWFDSNDQSTIQRNGTTLTAWLNKGSAGGSATTTTGTITYGSRTLNGRSIVNIPLGTEMTTSSYTLSQQAVSFFGVARLPDAIANNVTRFHNLFGSVASGGPTCNISSVNGTYMGNMYPTSNPFTVRYSSSKSFQTAARIVSFVNSTTLANNVATEDGTIQAPLTASVAASGYTTSSIPYKLGWAADTNGSSIDYAEFIAFNCEITPTLRQQVEGYLAWKWGLQSQLPAAHPYQVSFIGSPILNNPWLWYDAADASTITKSGTTLSGWSNKGYAGGGSGSVGAGTISHGTTTINGNSVMTFGGGSYFAIPTVSPTQKSFSNFAVVRINGTMTSNWDGIGIPSIASTANGQGLSVNYHSTTYPQSTYWIEAQNRAISSNTRGGISNPNMNFMIIGSVNSNSTTANNVITLNGSSLTLGLNNVSSSTLPTSVPDYRLGAPISLTTDIAEVIMLQGEITVAQRQQIEGYLAHKWGLFQELPQGHPYYPLYQPVWALTPELWLGSVTGPLTIPVGCQLWLDAADDARVISSGLNIAGWHNKTGGINTTVGGTPVIRENDLNGISTIGLRASNDYFTVANNFNDPGFTVVGMFRLLTGNNTGATFGIFSTDTANFFGRGLGLSTSANFVIISQNQFVDTSIPFVVGTWYIATLVFDMTTTCRLTINGTTTNVTVGNAANDNTTGFKIGIWNVDHAPNTNMDVTEVMCFNRALSSAEVARIEAYMAWKWGTQTALPSTHLFKAIASVPLTAPLNVSAVAAPCAAIVSWREPALTGGSPITGYRVTASPGSAFVDVDGNVHSARITGLTNGTSYTFTVAAKNAGGFGIASAASAAVVPSANVAPVYNGGSYYFNGTNSVITVPNAADLRFGTGDYTVEWWQYWIPTQEYPTLFAFGDLMLLMNIGTQFSTNDFSKTTELYPIQHNYFKYKWVHVAMTRQSGLARIFIDGKQLITYSSNMNFTNSTSNMTIGVDVNGWSGSRFCGFLSQFHFVVGTALYTSEFVPPTSEIQPVANTKILLLAKSAGSLNADYSPVVRGGITTSNIAWSSAGPFAPLVSMPYQRLLVSTFAGSGSAALTDATGTAAAFSTNTGIWIDSADNIFVADFANHKIRMITPAGVVSSLGGTVGVPQHVVRDSQGNTFASGWSTNQIWKQAAGTSTFVSFVGSTAGTGGYQDGSGSNALFSNLARMAIDASDNLYICDYSNHKIRRITPAGVVTTFAGPLSGTASGTDDGPANSASFTRPTSCAFDSQGNLFVTDIDGHKIRKITPAGVVSTFAGAPVGSTANGTVDGRGTTARFSAPDAITIDKYDNMYVFDRGTAKIRKITPDAVVTTIAGPPMDSTNFSYLDGIDEGARFTNSEGLAIDSHGALFISNTGSNRIRKAAIGSRWQVQTLAGLAGTAGTAVGDVSGVRFTLPAGTAVGSDGAVYVADNGNNRIIKITPDGNAVVLAGSGTAGGADGVGTAASLNAPYGITMDANENLFVSDQNGNRIRKITPAGYVTTIAGTGVAGFADGHGSIAQFNYLTHMTIDMNGNLYVADMNNNRIRKLTPGVDGYTVSTFAGNGTATQVNNTTAITSTFTSPLNITCDSSTVYVMDANTSTIRRIPMNGGAVTSINSHATANIRGLCFNKYDGYLYYCSVSNNSLYRILPNGSDLTLVAGGNTATNAVLDAVGSNARFAHITGGAVDAYGNLIVSDLSNPTGSTVRLVKYAIPPAAPTLSASIATISWSAPANNGLPITGYDVLNSYGARVSTLGPAATSYTATVSGTYRVRAINNAGVGTAASITVSTATVPDAPTGVVATAGYLQATVSWTAPASNGGAAITAYRVFDATGTTQYGPDVSGTSTTITGLTAGQSYQFTVRAINIIGQSAASSASNSVLVFTTPGVPRNFTVVPGTTSAVLNWSAPLVDGSSAIIAYRITDQSGATVDVSANVLTRTFTGLTAGRTYTYNVRAQNAAGFGTATTTTSVVPYTTPGIPRNFSATDGSGQIVLNWAAPLLDGSSSIISYRITDQSGATVDVSANVFSRTFSGLVAGRTYSYTVMAQNAAGYGSASTAASLLVFGKPGVPQNVAATDGSGQVVVSWSAPVLDGSSNILSYRITDQSGATVDVSANVFSRTFSGLVAGRTYSYTVMARNAAGFGTASAAASLLVFSKPGAPTGVSAAGGNQSAVITWTAASANSSTITNYRITASPGGLFKDVSGDQTSGSVSGLTNGTSYTFTVVATNAAGAGPASSVSNAVVPNAPPTGPFYVVNLNGGSYKVGNTATTNLYTTPSDLSDADGIPANAFTYKWQIADVSSDASFADISGATASTYVIPVAYVGKYLRAIVNYTDSAGVAESVKASAVGPLVSTVPYAPIIGTAIKGNGEATVSWTAPTNDGGLAITKYTITASPGSATADVSGDQNSGTVSGLTNGTSYTLSVAATNANGLGASSAASNTVVPSTVPAAPAFTLSTVGNASVSLSWSAPDNGGAEITKYTIYDVSAGTSFDVSGDVLSTPINGLTNGTTYTYTVAAYNLDGYGPQSSSVSLTPYTNPGAPSITNVVSGNGYLRVSFSPPADTGGYPITSYSVFNNSGNALVKSDIPASATYVDVSEADGLTIGQAYLFKMKAYTAVGETQTAVAYSGSGVILGTLPDAPTPTAVAGSSKTTLSWSAPAYDGYYTITKYSVYTASGVFVQDVSSTATSVDLSGTPGVSYSYKMTSTNAIGESAQSAATTSVIPYTIPDAPTNVVAVGGDRSAVITWTAAAANSSTITNYRITASPGGLYTDVSGTETSGSVSGLTNGVSYTFTVVATNAAGAGPASSASNAVVPNALPTGTFNVINLNGTTSYKVGNTAATNLLGSPTDLSDADGIPANAYTYQWQIADVSSEASFANITGATASTYVVPVAYVGKYLRAIVSFTDNAGVAESVKASAVGPIETRVPYAPTIGTATRGNASATVTWSAPNNGGLEITKYTITSSPGGITKDVSGNLTSGTITGLTNGTSYTFTVAATNANGLGDSSAASNAVTPLTTPSAPQNFRVVAGINSATLYWDPVADIGGSNVAAYRITDQSGNIEWRSEVLSRTLTFTGLTAGRTYSYFMVAVSSIMGAGTPTPTLSVVPYTVPGVPRNVSATDGSGQVVVSWEAPLLDGSSEIIGYRIADQSGNNTDVSANVFSNIFTGLNANQTYSYTVAALNAAGYGTASAAASLLVFGKPGAPTIITAAGGNTSAVLVWSAAAANSSTITKYTITASPGGLTKDVSGSETTGTITGLTNGVSYTFTITATNAAGVGVASTPSPAIVPNAPPTGSVYLVDLNGSPSYVVGDDVATNLYTTPSDVSDTDGIPNGFNYQWQVADASDGFFEDVCGETQMLFTIEQSEVDMFLRAIVSYTDGAGNTETLTTNVIGPITTTVPYAPTNLSAVGGAKEVSVSWTAPNNGGLPISTYTVSVNPADVESVEVSGNSATISGLQVNTEYTISVYAINANGNGTSATTVATTTDYPAALTFSSVDVGNGSVVLHWSDSSNGGSAITGYTIYNITDEVQYTDISGGQRSYTVAGLTNDVEYTFAISATNANGEGPSSGGNVSVIPFTVPDAPVATATSLNNGDIRVSWTTPADNGRDILDYRITDGSGQMIDISESPYTFSGLTLGRTYTYTVAARSAASYSAESAQVSALSRTTPTAPQNLQALADISSVVLSWSVPASNGGSAVFAYRVYNAANVQVGSDVSGLSTTVDGLTNGTEYTFYVRAVNVAGESENSNGATATPRRAPDAPTIISVVYGNALIDLSWNAPAFNGGSEIIDYRVYYNGLTKDVSSGTSTTLTGLTNGTLYTIQIAARNVVGYGTLSDTFTATPSTVPDAPVMGTPVAASRRITVHWSAPVSNGGAAVSSYELYFDGSSEPIATGITGTSYVVINLTNDVQYQFRVAAVNINGAGTLSAASTATAPFNTPPTGDVDISGLIVEGAHIEMVNTLVDVDGLGPLQYKWFRVVSGVSDEISAQILSSYTIREGDVGAQIFGMIYYTDLAGTNELAHSETVGPVAAFAVQNLSAVARSAQVDLSWNVPETNGKVITGYRVRHHLSSVDASGAASQIVQDLSASIVGLTNGASYTFRVAVGYDGTYGTESLITETPYTVPDAPTIVSTVADVSSIRVSWSAPAFNGGRAISGYDLSCNGQVVQLGAEDLSYNITGLTNGQSYTIEVRARNIAGLGAAATTSEIPYTTPSAPTVTSIVAGHEQVSLQWTPGFDGGRPITGYKIYYGYDSVDVPGTSRTIGSLTNAVQQSFYVVAINAAGEGAASATVYETPYTVPDAPTGLNATAGVRSVSLVWSAPADNGRAIDYYRVSEAGGATYDVLDGSTSLLIEDLSNGTTYTYTVAAHNLAGFSSESASDSATPRTVPDKPVDLIATPGDLQVDLSWTEPYNGGAAITEYRIVYGDVSGISTTTSFHASGLTNGTTYVFYVYAINEAGSSLAQTVVSVPRTIPGTPTAPLAIPADRSITIYWDIPASDGGSAITGYRVAYGSTSVPLSASDLQYTANDLTNGQSYTFNVYAINVAGTSATPLSITSTPRTTPDAVQNLSAVHKNGAVDLSWNVPAFNGGAAIDYYRVSYAGTYKDVSDGTSTTIQGLTNGTEYTFSVAAHNVAGYGTASTVSATPSTLPGKPVFGMNFGSNGAVQLSWSVDDGGAPILSSKIYYVSSIGGAPSTYDVSGSATNATVPGLTNGTYYLFAVESTNLNGTGPSSEQSSPVAPYTAPDAPAITLVRSGDGFMHIEWTHSEITGGFPLSKFVIYLTEGTLIKDAIDPSLRSIDISENLLIGSSYTFKMKAFTAGTYGEVAQSAFSPAASGGLATVLGTRPDAPSITDLSSGDATIRVSWSAPVYTGYYAITRYTVYDAAGAILADNIDAADRYVDISVPNGVPIAVKMTSTNQIGTSEFSAETATVIPSRVPDAPTGLSAVHGDQQIALSWIAPVNDGSANIIKYGVYYADGTAIDENVVDTSFNVIGLTNGQSYTFKVAAFNIRGRGAFSEPATEIPSRVPDAPPKPSATAGNRTAVVFWDAPAANGSAISLYEVYDGSGVKWADTSATLVDISGLTNGVYYQFRVRAQNRDGFGSYSALSDAVRPNADVSGSVDISGIFMEGQTIEAVLNLSDEDGLPTLFNYQWQVASASVGPYTDISGEIASTFAITAAYVRKYLRVYVAYTDLAGVPEEVYSGFVGPVNDVPSGLDISGSPVEAQTLVADFTNFVDQDGYDMATFAYQWSDSSDGVVFTAISGATASSLLLTQAQVDKYVRLVVSYTDNTNMPHVISATVGPVANINNAPVGQPLITGTVAIGQTVYTDFTPVSDLDGIDMNSLTYQWQIADAADGFFEDVCGETQVSFEIDRAKVNQFLRVKVDYTDLYGASEEVISVVASAVPPTVPDAPTGLAAAHGDTYVDLSWNAPAWTGGIDLSGYIIYRVDGATTTEVARTVAGDVSERISGLTNGTLYVFQVSAYNVVGEGAVSASASETPSRPASAPQSLAAVHNDGYVSLSWIAPASDGGAAISGYKVFNGSTEVASVGGAIRAIDISGLTNGVSYTFTVYAENRDGLGDGVNVSVIPSRTPDAPASISVEHDDRAITVSWTEPAFDGGAPLLGYYVYGSGLLTQNITSGLSATFTGLTNGTSYSFFVRAYNLNGFGAATETVSEYPNTTPSAPRDVSGTPGNSIATLTWLAPLSNGGDAIQGYRIYEGSTLRGSVGPNELSGTATGLTNGTPATLVVRAFNRSGDGVASASITITPNGFASVVQNLTAVSGNASVLLTWQEPTYNGGTGILDYVVKTYSGASLVSTTTFSGLSGEVTGLTNGTTYTFFVYGRTLAGLGEESSITSKPYTVPGPVRNLTATRGDGQLSLAWLAPVSNGGDTITSYRIVRDGSATIDTGNTTTSRTITGLNNGQRYNFTVQAQNARGFGTAVDVSGTPSRAPYAITDASGLYGDRTATLYWNAPYDGGSPIVQYRVYLNGIQMATVLPSARSYTFEELTNGTTYTMNVRAENHTLAEISNTVSQTPRTIPSAPTGILVDPSRNLVRVSWTIPYNGGATITRFEVGDVSAGNAVVATVSSATATTVNVSGLTNGQAYRFVVRAVNSEGAGPWSAMSSVVYPGDVPSKPTITSVSYENEAITVSWSAPTDLGGFAVDMYRIYYTGSATPVDVSGNVLTRKITGLTNGTLYQFTVYAVNFKGTSAASDISAVIKPSRFPDAPAKPTVSGHGDGSITIQWSAPNDRGDAIQGYRVYLVGSDVVRANPLGASSTSAIITGLTNGTNYQFRVHAYNRDGPSPLSDASDPEFPSRVPDAPIVNAPTHGNGQVSLSWVAPYDGGAPILYYRIYRQTVGTSTWDLIETTADGSVLSTTATGVDNGTAYVFRVDAVNRDGTTQSAPSAQVVPSTVPGVPLGGAKQHGDLSANLSWEAPAWNGGNAIIGYRVFDISADETTATPLADVSGLSANIFDLLNGTTYIFKVLAYNINGQGPTLELPAVVPSRIPDPVVVVAAKPGDRSILLRWTAPYNGGAPITSYRIYDQNNNVLRDVSGASTLTALFQNLTNNQSYTYRVKAFNLNGFSANFSNDVSGTPFVVDLSENLPPKQQESVITTSITKANQTTEVIPLVATTVENDKTTGVVSVVTSDPKLSNVMVANVPTSGEKVVDEVVVAVAPKTEEFGVIIAVKAFQVVQTAETTTRTAIRDFNDNPLTIVLTLPGETALTVDVYTRPDDSQPFVLEGKATRLSAAANTYTITIRHLTQFAFKVLNIVPCFPMGTRVLTAVGYKAIEKLTAADRIMTSDGRAVPFARAMELIETTTEETAPYLIPAHTFGRNQPPAPITLSPHHAFQSRKGVWQIPLFAAQAFPQIKQVDVGRAVLYFHLKLPNYLRDNVVVEGGIVAESYGGPEYGTLDTIYSYSSRLGGFTRRSTNKDAPKATLQTKKV